jgi:hypothetical protein
MNLFWVQNPDNLQAHELKDKQKELLLYLNKSLQIMGLQLPSIAQALVCLDSALKVRTIVITLLAGDPGQEYGLGMLLVTSKPPFALAQKQLPDEDDFESHSKCVGSGRAGMSY